MVQLASILFWAAYFGISLVTTAFAINIAYKTSFSLKKALIVKFIEIAIMLLLLLLFVSAGLLLFG
jgi:hypothetical protein